MQESEKDSKISLQTSDAQRGRQAAGAAAAALVEPGMVIGLGTGDTAAQFIHALGSRVAAGLSNLRCVATSLRSADLGQKLGLTCLPLDAFDLGPHATEKPIDLTVDGADEIDGALRLVKGAGGALLFEKLVARASKRLVIVADPQKLVTQLGEKRLLPVEVVAFGAGHTLARLRALSGVLSADLRKQKDKDDLRKQKDKDDLRKQKDKDDLYVTDGGNRIIDVKLDASAEHGIDAAALHAMMKALPGVIETGFFLGEATQVILGNPDGRVEMRQRS